MKNLNEFIKILTGEFNNLQQYETMKKKKMEFPYAEHVNIGLKKCLKLIQLMLLYIRSLEKS